MGESSVQFGVTQLEGFGVGMSTLVQASRKSGEVGVWIGLGKEQVGSK